MVVSSFNRSEASGETRRGGGAELMSGEDPAEDQSHPVSPEDLSGKRHRGRHSRDPIEAVKDREQW